MRKKLTLLLDFVSLTKVCHAAPNICDAEGILLLGNIGDFIPVSGDDPGQSLMNDPVVFSAACFEDASRTPAECIINGQATISKMLLLILNN